MKLIWSISKLPAESWIWWTLHADVSKMRGQIYAQATCGSAQRTKYDSGSAPGIYFEMSYALP
jgi:hypothetical protein